MNISRLDHPVNTLVPCLGIGLDVTYNTTRQCSLEEIFSCSPYSPKRWHPNPMIYLNLATDVDEEGGKYAP